MSEVDALERDVVDARARLLSRVAQLKSPGLTGLKEEFVTEATAYKDEMVDRAKQKATSTVDSMVADLKSRAAANPIAVAAIGAGIAWKLYQKPPITTLLVGAGLAALFGRSNVREIEADPYATEYPTSYVPGGIAGQGYSTTVGSVEQKAIGGATVVVETVREKFGELRDKAVDLTDRALDSAGELRDRVMGSADELRTSVAQSSGRAADRVSLMTNDARERFGTGREYTEDMVRENPVYFGIAALAIGAAAGIGLMQRNKPEEYQRASYVEEDYLARENIRLE